MILQPVISRFVRRQIGNDSEISCLSLRVLPDWPKNEVVVLSSQHSQETCNVIDAPIAGYHVECPHCDQELRISKKYVGMAVACKFCNGQFQLDPNSKRVRTKAVYSQCPHCEQELRVAQKYLGMTVACKFCDGHLKVVAVKSPTEPARTPAPISGKRISQHAARRR